MTGSRSICITTNDPGSLFLWLSNIPLYICTTLFGRFLCCGIKLLMCSHSWEISNRKAAPTKGATVEVCSSPPWEAAANKLEDHGKAKEEKRREKCTEHPPRETPLKHS